MNEEEKRKFTLKKYINTSMLFGLGFGIIICSIIGLFVHDTTYWVVIGITIGISFGFGAGVSIAK